MRTFSTGATRDTNEGKPDYRGYLSPLVIRRFGEYMLKHQVQSDGTIRASDNWKKGMPEGECLSSGLRHVLDVWLALEGYPQAAREDIEDALCAGIFNLQVILHELLKKRGAYGTSPARPSGDRTGARRSEGRTGRRGAAGQADELWAGAVAQETPTSRRRRIRRRLGLSDGEDGQVGYCASAMVQGGGVRPSDGEEDSGTGGAVQPEGAEK